MRSANCWIIANALVRLDAAENERGDLGIDPDDSESLQKVFDELVTPEVKQWAPVWRERLRVSLAYFLQTEKREVLDGVLASRQDSYMPEPKDVLAFFKRMWDSVFPGDSYDTVSIGDVVEKNDGIEANNIKRTIEGSDGIYYGLQ